MVNYLEKIYIRDPIYDEIIVFRETEEPLINKWEVQRLRYIKQLQLTYLVYPSATHTRFEHSLGVMHIASEFVTRLIENADDKDMLKKIADLRSVSDTAFIRMNRVIARIAGLLHDIGHGPLGHLFDEYIIPSLYTENEREILQKMCFSHEVISFFIYWYRLRDIIRESLSRTDDFKRYVDDLITWLDQIMIPICRDPETWKPIYHELFKVEFSGYGYFLRMIIRDYLYPADLIDYLLRDSTFSGAVELGRINRHRLIRYTRPFPRDHVLDKLREEQADKQIELYKELPTPIILVINDKVLPDLIRFLDARRLMYENVYLHRVIRAFGWSAIRILSDEETWHHVGFYKKLLLRVLEKPTSSDLVNEFLDEYLELTDDILLSTRRLVKKRIIRDNIIEKHIKALFDDRKPLYKSIVSEIIPAVPYLTTNMRSAKEIRVIEEELRNTILESESNKNLDISDQVKIGIEQIQIYPSTAWNIQGPGIFMLIDGTIRLYTIEEFSKRYHLSNVGEIRLYVDRTLSNKLKDELRKKFLMEIKDNIERRNKLKELIGQTIVSTVTM